MTDLMRGEAIMRLQTTIGGYVFAGLMVVALIMAAAGLVANVLQLIGLL